MICPFQSKECQAAECMMWGHENCLVTDGIFALVAISSTIDSIESDLEAIKERGFPDPGLSHDSIMYEQIRKVWTIGGSMRPATSK